MGILKDVQNIQVTQKAQNKKLTTIEVNSATSMKFLEQIAEYVQRTDSTLHKIVGEHDIMSQGGGYGIVEPPLKHDPCNLNLDHIRLKEVDEEIAENKKRDTINRAFQDIEQLLRENQLPYVVYGHTFYLYDVQRANAKVEFEERNNCYTTAKLYIFQNGKWKEWKKAHSICLRVDEFVPVIGQVIALHRLFELDVPEEYLNIPQVGHVELNPNEEVSEQELLIPMTAEQCELMRELINAVLEDGVYTTYSEDELLRKVRDTIMKKVGIKHRG